MVELVERNELFGVFFVGRNECVFTVQPPTPLQLEDSQKREKKMKKEQRTQQSI